MKENIYRYSVVALLAAILTVQLVTMSRQRIIVQSDVYGVEASKKSPKERAAIMAQIPLVNVFDAVDVSIQENPLPVQIIPSERPLWQR